MKQVRLYSKGYSQLEPQLNISSMILILKFWSAIDREYSKSLHTGLHSLVIAAKLNYVERWEGGGGGVGFA